MKNLDSLALDIIKGCLTKNPMDRFDIKHIINHQFFKKYCTEYMNNQSGLLTTTPPRASNSKMSEMMR